MFDDLKKLLNVQEKDLQIFDLEERKTFLPQKLDQGKSSLNALVKEVESAKTVLRELQVAHKKLEIDLEQKISTRQKYETQLMSVKSNQEYKALEKEIFGMKTEVSRIEDQILEKMMSLDAQNEAIKKLEIELQKLKTEYAEEEFKIKNEIEAVETQLKNVRSEKEGLAKDVDTVLFKRYVRILDHVHGKAIVPIIDRSCQGCHTSLPPQVFVDIRRQDSLITCENCSRLLFIPDETDATEDGEKHPHGDDAGKPIETNQETR